VWWVCEPEHGPLLSEDGSEAEKRSIGDLLNHMDDSGQQEDLMIEIRCLRPLIQDNLVKMGVKLRRGPLEIF